MGEQLYSYPAGATINGVIFTERTVMIAQTVIIDGVTHPAENLSAWTPEIRASFGVKTFAADPFPEDCHPGEPEDVETDTHIQRAWPNATPDPAAIEARRKAGVLAQIADMEAQQTPRRIREAALTEEGKAWLEGLDAQIAVLRAQLAG